LAPTRTGLRVGASRLLAHRAIGMSASAPLFLHGLSVPAPGTPNSLPIGQFSKTMRFQNCAVHALASIWRYR